MSFRHWAARRSARRCIFVVAALAVSSGVAAQDDASIADIIELPPEEQPAVDRAVPIEAVEEIVVTGSRISRNEFSSSSPITTFSDEDFLNSGLVTVDEFLKEIPAFTGFQLGASTNNGAEQGQRKIDLRGLGFKRSLVLINGRRQVVDTNDDDTGVDLNTIPENMIKRVEVLKDGASSAYGSDALAGVVNFILKDDFEGFELGATYGLGTDDGQAANRGVNMLAGFQAGDSGYLLLSAGFDEQDEMKQAERPFATSVLYPLLMDGRFVNTPSGSSNSRRIRLDADQDGTPEANRIVDAQTGQARPFAPDDVYNFAPVNALITPLKRYQLGSIGEFNIGNFARGYTELLFTRRSSLQRLAPDASFSVTTVETPNNGQQMNDFVPANNPFNPYGVNPRNDEGLSDLDVRINRRFVESGGRIFAQAADTFRIATGMTGQLFGLDYDLSYIVAENQTIDETRNYGRFDRWAIAVDPVACEANAACTAAGGVLNPFDDYGSISQSQMNYLTAGSLKDVYRSRLEQTSFVLTGDAFPLIGGMMGWAFGLEHRHESGEFIPDEFLAEGLTTSGAADPLSGSFTAREAFGEVFLPVLDNLNVDAGLRFSDYNNSAGSTVTYKLGLDYEATTWMRVRSGLATGFRAPNIAELNQGNQTNFPVVDPLCEFGDRRLEAGAISQTAYDNCVALGIDTTDAGEYGFQWQSVYTEQEPTTPLDPEESTTFTLGLVMNPLDQLSLGIDYFNITVDNVIDVDDINDLFRACMNSAGFTADACGVFTTGTPYNGPFPDDVVNELGNLGKLKTSGVDFEANYLGGLKLGPISGYNARLSATYLASYERQFPLAGTRELAGTANAFSVFPDWKINADLSFEAASWRVNWGMRYISATNDALRPAAVTSDAKAESVIYHNLGASMYWGEAVIAVGINNLTNVTPPYFHSAFNANTEPGMYDVIGRRFFSSVRWVF